MSQRSVLISVPARSTRDIDMRTRECIHEVLVNIQRQGWSGGMAPHFGDADLAGARNLAVAGCLAGAFTDLLFWDSDVFCDRGSAERLLSHPVDLVVGVYPRRGDGAGYPVRTIPGNRRLVDPVTMEPKDDGLMEIVGGPCGFMRISRRALEYMTAVHADRWYADPRSPTGKAWNLFEFAVRDHERYTEDLDFCMKWRDLGEKVWTDPHLRLHHHGEKTYSGSLIEHLTELTRNDLAHVPSGAPATH
jgi:hypothetical protein